MTILFLILIEVFGACATIRQPQIATVSSPDTNIKIAVKLDQRRRPIYSVSYKGKEVLGESTLGIEFRKAGLLSPNLKITGVQRESVDSTYNIIAGKSDSARNHYNEIKIQFMEKTQSNRHFSIAFRAYNDGVGLRYLFPKTPDQQNFEIEAEKTTFHFPSNHKVWAANYGSYNTSQESEFKESSLDSVKTKDIIGLPITIKREDGIILAIVEADLENYAGMYVGADKTEHTLVTKLAPLPDSSGVLVRGKRPFKTPWRVLMIGDGPGALITSNLITNLNHESRIKDTSWIKPGKVVFPWWPDFKTDDPKTSGKFNYQNQKRYIDFASAYNIPYLEMEPPWYGPEKDVIQNPLDYDITKPIPRLHFFKLLNYAKAKGVNFFLWMHWKSMQNQLDEALATYEKWGVAGIKIDYMNRDDQDMVNFYHKLAHEAAKHHLMVYYHGAYKPTGLRRTWPNVLTREAVLGLEYNKWSKRVTFEHTVTLPFTRMLVGPMDFTPGGFTNITKKQFKVDWSNPMVMGTRAHQLSMYVLYLSPLQMVADYPGAIANKPGSNFIKNVPTSWDETRFIKGEIGNYIALARRKGNKWFIGVMTDGSSRNLKLPLDFLPDGDFEATVYADGKNADKEPKQLKIKHLNLNAGSKVSVNLAPGGGWVAYLKSKQQ